MVFFGVLEKGGGGGVDLLFIDSIREEHNIRTTVDCFVFMATCMVVSLLVRL